MSKPKKYGLKTGYIPNSKADMRHHKKLYQRGREKAFQNVQDKRGREKENKIAHSKLCPRLFGKVIRWIDGEQFVVLIGCREIIGNKKYWGIEDGK